MRYFNHPKAAFGMYRETYWNVTPSVRTANITHYLFRQLVDSHGICNVAMASKRNMLVPNVNQNNLIIGPFSLDQPYMSNQMHSLKPNEIAALVNEMLLTSHLP